MGATLSEVKFQNQSSYILRRPQNFAKVSPFLQAGTKQDKSKVNISQNFVTFSEYMNFNTQKIARDFFKTFRGACVNPKWKKSRKFVDATL